MAKSSRGGRMTAAKRRAAKSSGGKGRVKNRAVGKNFLQAGQDFFSSAKLGEIIVNQGDGHGRILAWEQKNTKTRKHRKHENNKSKSKGQLARNKASVRQFPQ